MATLTYVHADRTAVIGPLATYAEPHTYDLCADHATRLTAPRGWTLVRLEIDLDAARAGRDDLSALADAIRSSGTSAPPAAQQAPRRPTPRTPPGKPRLHIVEGD